MKDNYSKYRGKCKSFCEEEISKDSSLTLVRGFYHCPFWGKQSHWWIKREDGTIYDPTKLQFPSCGIGEYEEFDGNIECSECGKKVPENEAFIYGNYGFCSSVCACHFVGIF